MTTMLTASAATGTGRTGVGIGSVVEGTKVVVPEAGKGVVIQTELDQMIDLLNEKKKIKLSALAKQFGRDISVVEEWAKTLHDEGLAELVYPFAGSPFIKLKEVEKVGKEKKEED